MAGHRFRGRLTWPMPAGLDTAMKLRQLVPALTQISASDVLSSIRGLSWRDVVPIWDELEATTLRAQAEALGLSAEVFYEL